ncbi:hypothetical protein Aduo_006557 [Ancylostoma duodenale]
MKGTQTPPHCYRDATGGPQATRNCFESQPRACGGGQPPPERELKFQELVEISQCTSQNVSVPPCTDPRSSSPAPTPVEDSDKERKRCVVVVGMRESASPLPSRRLVDEINEACHFMDFPGVGCSPASVFRMERPNPSYPRLVKIVLLTSFHANLMLRRAPRLNNYTTQKIFIRPSLPKVERDRLRAEREARRKNVNRSDMALDSSSTQTDFHEQNDPSSSVPIVQPPVSNSSASNQLTQMSN